MATGAKKKILREEVRDALLELLRDKKNPATARASAARTLADFFGDDVGGGHKRAEEMTADEIDQEIASIQQRKT